MSHRQEDNYGYVATETIRTGMVVAFMPGDAVPDDTVEEHGFLDSGQVVARADWGGLPEDEPERAPKRGEMPPHLRTESKTEPKQETGTEKSVKSGGSSRKTPDATKGSGS